MRYRSGTPDYVLVIMTFMLVVIGLVMVASASSELAKKNFGDSYFFLKHQILYGLLPGLAGFAFTSFFPYKRYQRWAVPLLFVTIGLLSLIFTPLGFSAGGADRWLHLGPLVFQPSELLKITFIIYLAAWLTGREERKTSFWKGFVSFMIISGLVSILLIIQPSTSTVAVLMIAALIMYFISGARFSYILGVIGLGVLALAVISYVSPYRWQRIMTFVNPTSNVESSGYHINQALIAIGSGGVWGVGYGQSTTKLLYLPEPIGDSIFAVLAEEFGFAGSIFLIALFLALIIRGFILSQKIGDQFGKLLLIGFSSIIGIQAFIHIGAISGLLPLTGTPLPYVSYGGTALAAYLTVSGIMVNISKFARH